CEEEPHHFSGQRHQRSNKCFFALTLAHASASGGPGFLSMSGFHPAASSLLRGIQSRWSSGTSSSAKMASTGHSGTHRVQSMHSSGSMTSMFGPSRKQSTGHTSTQSVYLHLMQLSVTTYVIGINTLPPILGSARRAPIIKAFPQQSPE